ncbi:MAG: tetratricopeptide repeat protein [Deltaproteobacteria bacterium]|nr:tetratricopeptide repeat protein [Deltaproteobacteria bacterium]
MKHTLSFVLGAAWSKRWIAVFLCVFWAGCADEVDRAAGHQKAAEAYLEAGETAKAVIELENVVQLEPRNEAAYQRLGEAYLELGRFGPAFQAFRRVTLLESQNLEAQLKVGQLYLLAGKLEDARAKAQLVLAHSGEHAGALTLLADVHRMEGDIDSAIGILNKAASLAPEKTLNHLHLARLHLRKGSWRRADKAFQRAARTDPSRRALLADTEAPYVSLPVLARHYERSGMWEEAKAAYRAAAKTASGEDVSSLLDLAAFHTRREDYRQALKAVERAASLRKMDLNVRVDKAEVLMLAGRAGEAEEEVDAVLKRFKDHVSANLLKGRLLASREAWAEALPRFERVVRAKPKLAPGHYFRGLCLARRGETALALESLEEAVSLDPAFLSARVLLAGLYLEHYEKGHLSRAGEHIRAALRIAPQDPRLLILLGNLRIRQQDLPGAEAVLLHVTRTFPSYAMAHFRLGFVYYLMERRAEALQQFRSALEQDASAVQALPFCVQLLLDENRFEEAAALCDRVASHAEASAHAVAVARHLKGKVHLAQGDLPAAERMFLSAIEMEPNLLPPHVLLTRLYLERKRTSELVTHFEAVLSKSPDFLPAYMVLGMVHDQAGERVKANRFYRRALEVKCDFAPAANNLAWNLAVEGVDLDEAFSLARTAKAGMPGDPHVSDTMGWVYYLLGHHWKAVGELEQAVSMRPGDPMLNYHLGRVYLEAGEPEKGRVFLIRALEAGRAFPGEEEARRLLEAGQLQTGGSGPGRDDPGPR